MEKLTKKQKQKISKIEKKGFKKDLKNSGFEKEKDGTFFYNFFAKDRMGVEMIKSDGTSEGNLLN
jgi:hypothetical protein